MSNDNDHTWKVGQRVQVYATMERGEVVERTLETNPRDGYEEGRYLVNLDGGARVWFWGSQLELFTEEPRRLRRG